MQAISIAFFNITRFRSGLLPVLILSAGIVTLSEYLESTLVNFIIATAAVILVLRPRSNKRTSWYFLASFVFMAACWMLPVKTWFFFSLAFAIFFWLEKTFDLSAGVPGLAAVFFGSPAFEYASAIISFPLRMEMASWVSALFAAWDPGVSVKGNTVHRGGDEFAVDAACMGLQMISLSLLLGIMFVGLQQRKTGRYLSWFPALVLLLVLFVLNLFSNLIRMIVLIQFSILPGNPWHDVAGLVCFAIYVCIPAAWLARYFVKYFGRSLNKAAVPLKKYRWPGMVLSLAMVLTACKLCLSDSYQSFHSAAEKSVPGFAVTLGSPGVIKLVNDEVLVYAKFIRAFYDTEHHPMICWKGSGYEFKHIREQVIGQQKLYTAVLYNGKDSLHTSWWYYNGKTHTHEQWRWRMDMLKGAPHYALINVSAISEQELARQVQLIIRGRRLAPLFEKQEP